MTRRSAAPARQLAIAAPSRPVPPPDRGRVFHVEDVQALYGTKPDGTPRRSRWWVTHSFAPECKHKDGKNVWWWEYEALGWMDDQRPRRP